MKKSEESGPKTTNKLPRVLSEVQDQQRWTALPSRTCTWGIAWHSSMYESG